MRRALTPVLAIVAGGAVTAGLALLPVTGAPAATGSPATDGPGSLSRFDLARKDCVGTARNGSSKVWYTVADGVLSDVYEPFVDNTNVHSLEYVVTDGATFTDTQTRDMTYTVSADETGMTCTVTSTDAAHGFRLVTTYVTDPARDSVVMHTTLEPTPGSHTNLSDLAVYARLDAHVNGNGGGGSQNGGADTGVVDASGVPVVYDEQTETQAANRDYAVPTYMALTSDDQGPASVGYADAASDGLTALDARHDLSPTYSDAPNGHVVATTQVRPDKNHHDFTLALGFGRTQASAVSTAQRSATTPFAMTSGAYDRTWTKYDKGLRQPAKGSTEEIRRAYWLSANVLKSSEDKTFPGAVAASLASPWGQAVSAGDLVGGKPVYFGSYREVFARDLYEAFTGFVADGDLATARAATRFLFERQQENAGNMPRNSLLNGLSAPDTGGIQLDETAYPILMAQLSGLGGDHVLYQDHVVPAADYLIAHGPAFGNERWEEQSGYSPSTIAAEIAGLTAAATIADQQGDGARAKLYQAVADHYQRTVKARTVTHHGPYGDGTYFIRLSKNGNPESEYFYGLGNGSVQADQRAVVDGGFQELVRLGELPADDPDVLKSLAVLDQQIREQTPTGAGYYRYGTSTAGTEDGYGDCWTPDPTDCPLDGQPWPTTGKGSGHLWPVLSGERAQSALALGDRPTATSQLGFMLHSASGVGLVPEQAWEDPDLARSAYGSDPTTASIGFQDGHAAGSASPLTWAQAQELRLIVALQTGTFTDRPAITTQRYVDQAPPESVPVSITSPADGSSASGTTTVTGTTTPGAEVVVGVVATDVPGTTDPVSTTAGADGSYSVSVPVAFGGNVITVTATTGSGTGFAQVSVVGDLVGGTTLLDTNDPSGDDNGPGTYQYPTASDFVAGSYDITRFQVLQQGSTVYLRTTLRTLVPTFGSPLGAQLLDVYVHDPAASTTSTAAPYATRNYSIAPADAWSQLVEVQGFAAPVWQDASGHQVGQVTAVVASQTAKTITIALPAAQLGTPANGWAFSVVLTGQDGYSPDQARSFAATPQPYQFGVCASGNTSPICSVAPNTVAKAVDVITPAGVDQSTELDPTQGPVVVHGVPVG